MRSEYEIGPPFEYESISFFASSNKSKAPERPLFSGLLISEQKDKNWSVKAACTVVYAGVPFNPNALQISLGDILPMDHGQPVMFDRSLNYAGYFLPEEDDKFIERVRAAVEEERQAKAAAA
ncbi:hypothetical protein POM88_029378 [Heracleum sosnowskyi]|uniref:Uncharacterized protein n=1 Tax=Heracleum sosnowskyi TaxID=360622 RepID=A0AAD8MES8_9APIA|nr:hypothetical protein POM88_029378 [Heracleum sosnowskyi]